MKGELLIFARSSYWLPGGRCFMRWWISVFLPLLLFALYATAESTDCNNPTIIVPDGRVTQSTFPGRQLTSPYAPATYWYGFYAQANHSYSIEFVPKIDNYATSSSVLLSDIIAYTPNFPFASCRGTPNVTMVKTQGYAPIIYSAAGQGIGKRVSFIASTAGLYTVRMDNNGTGGDYSYRVVDTTLFSPRWSTYSGYNTHWGFMNLSDMTVTGTLSVFDTSNRLLKTVTFSVAPGMVVFHFSFADDLNIPSDSAGCVYFTHNGPPGAILADAFLVNGPGTVVSAVRFEMRVGVN